ncbi:MAG: hypothetical protein ACKO23_15455, partial [Gemmataceae bacterium]
MAKSKESSKNVDESSLGLSAIIKIALDKFGHTVPASDVISWISKEYPKFHYNSNTLNSTLSNLKKKRRTELGLPDPTRKTSTKNGAPNLEELIHVKNYIDANGGLEKIHEHLQIIDAIASKVGGIERFRKCLEGLNKLNM